MTMDIVDEVFALFDRFGDHEYGEAVTQRAHALQAAHFAVEDGAPGTLVAAALLHDVGQFLESAGEAAETENRDGRHEYSGARFLAEHFPPAVVDPIRFHVAAKRYLCAVEPGYHDGLSAASQLSLRLQGGPFTAKQAAAFADQPYAADAVRLRRYDDLGKQVDLAVAPLESYRTLLKSLLL
jgi:[1-hydroxy-2-(trimethylamino)ethyl]phosphonate dioxygenase